MNHLTGTVRSSIDAGSVSEQRTSYSYDHAGSRVGQSIGGVQTSFVFDPAGRVTEMFRDGRSTPYSYDGLGRQVSSQHGVTSLVRDAAGELALQADGDAEVSWALLDRLGSTMAQSVGGSITQLAGYADFGAATFEISGWSSPFGYTGETADAGYGLNHYFARTYDPASGAWLSQDPYRGLLTQPETLHRYAYVGGNPVTERDYLGYATKRSIGDYIRVGGPAPTCNSDPRPPCANAGAQPAPPKPQSSGASPGSEPVKTPKKQSAKYEQPRHVNGATAGAPQFDWALLANVLSTIGTIANIAAPILAFGGPLAAAAPVVKILGVIAGAAGAIIECSTAVAKRTMTATCVLAAISSALGVSPRVVQTLVKSVKRESIESLQGFVRGFGINFDITGVMAGWGLYFS